MPVLFEKYQLFLLKSLYSVALSVLVLANLVKRCVYSKAYRQRWKERFGYFKAPDKSIDIWFHTISVGEFLATRPLIDACMKEWPELNIAISTTTLTGSAQVLKAYGERVFHVYFGYDFAFVFRRFIKKMQPKLVVVMETEIWPNFFSTCEKKNVPLIIANARLNAKSHKGYLKIPLREALLFGPVKHLLVQSNVDYERYLDLGCPQEKISVCGQLKFMQNHPADLEKKTAAYREMIGHDKLLWLAASTHGGEEKIILDIYRKLKTELSTLRLLIAPRHPERFNEVYQLAEQMGLTVARYSQNEFNKDNVDLYLIDTIGELMYFYAIADFAFVGGSLIPIGGHNTLEPASLGIATVTGQHNFNFQSITELLLEQQALAIAYNAEELAEKCYQLANNSELRKQMGESAKTIVAENQGSLEMIMQAIIPYASHWENKN